MKENAFVRNSTIFFAGSMIANVFNYAFHFSLGRMVSIETYGSLQSLLALLSIVSVPAVALEMIATKHAAIALAHDDKKLGVHLLSVLNRNIFRYGWPFLVIGILASPLIGSFLNIHDWVALVFVWVLAILTFFSSVSIGVLSGWQDFGAINLSGIVSAVTKFAIGIFFAWIGFGVDGIFFGVVLAMVIGYSVSVRSLWRRLGYEQNGSALLTSETNDSSFSFPSMREYVSTAFLGTLGLAILGNIDVVFAKHALSPDEAGMYGALSVVSKVIFFVTGALATVLFSMSAESFEKNGRKLVNISVFRAAFLLALVAVVVAVLCYFILPSFILSIFFGKTYQSASPMLGWFGLSAGLYALTNVAFQQLLSVRDTIAVRWLLGIAALEFIVILLFGSNFRSIIFIVIAIQALSLVASLVFIRKLYTLKR